MPQLRSLSRRTFLGTSAAVVGLNGLVPHALGQQATPDASTNRDPGSWFFFSPPLEDGYVIRTEHFQVYSGHTFERLGGFPAATSFAPAVTSDPAKALINTAAGTNVFDLSTGQLTPVAWESGEPLQLALPDPRYATAGTPAFTCGSRFDRLTGGLLIDLQQATGIDLETVLEQGETPFPVWHRFSPDGAWLVTYVSDAGMFLMKPDDPSSARFLNMGDDDLSGWSPDFSPDSSRILYLALSLEQPDEVTMVIEDVASGEIVTREKIEPDVLVGFPTDANDELLFFKDGTVSRRTIEGDEAVWETQSERTILALGASETHLLLQSAPGAEATPVWQVIDLATGDSIRLPELGGLRYINASYPSAQNAFQIFGPPEPTRGDPSLGPLVGLNMETFETLTLMESVNANNVRPNVAISADSGVVFYGQRSDTDGLRVFTFDLRSNDRQVFELGDYSGFIEDMHVAADGSAGGCTVWKPSGAGQNQAWVIDLSAGEGTAEVLGEGRIWRWAGGVEGEESTLSAHRQIDSF